MRVSSTSNLEGFIITKYYDVIVINGAVNVVDISEWFIGVQNSGAASNSMEHLKKKAINELISSAESLGADAIIGFSIDFGQIGGKSGGMLMVTAFGTPVKTIKSDEKIENNILNLIEKFIDEKNEDIKLMLEVEIRQKNIDKDLQDRLILREIEKREKIKRELEERCKRELEFKMEENIRLMQIKEDRTKDASSFKKYLESINIALLVCENCSTMIETAEIDILKCKTCGETLLNAKQIS